MNFYYLFWLTLLIILFGFGFLFSIYLLGIEIKKNQQLEYGLLESNTVRGLLIEAMTELGYYDKIKAKAKENLREFADNYQGGK